jgi:hypothetical protein
MRFEVGQAYECIEDGGSAVVARIRNDGREGLLRFLETGTEEWIVWVELHQGGKWKLLDPTT